MYKLFLFKHSEIYITNITILFIYILNNNICNNYKNSFAIYHISIFLNYNVLAEHETKVKKKLWNQISYYEKHSWNYKH